MNFLPPIVTEDGSHTLRSDHFSECYHSQYGAIQESDKIFLRSGLMHWVERASYVAERSPLSTPSQPIRLLEMGFGTGLNALLTALYAHEQGIYIHYTTVELYPLSLSQVETLNYPALLAPSHAMAHEWFLQLHHAPWGETVAITPFFALQKCEVDFLQFVDSPHPQGWDVVYFDAFSPQTVPLLWSDTLFEQLALQLNTHAVLTTYCAKGSVRRALQSCGLQVERLPGPPGKREFLRATQPLPTSISCL